MHTEERFEDLSISKVTQISIMSGPAFKAPQKLENEIIIRLACEFGKQLSRLYSEGKDETAKELSNIWRKMREGLI